MFPESLAILLGDYLKVKINRNIKHILRIDRAVRLVWKAAPGWTLANFILQVIQGVLPLAGLYLIKLIVDAVTLSLTSPDKGMAFKQIVSDSSKKSAVNTSGKSNQNAAHFQKDIFKGLFFLLKLRHSIVKFSGLRSSYDPERKRWFDMTSEGQSSFVCCECGLPRQKKLHRGLLLPG